MGPTQDLAQKVCQRYGWSATFSKDKEHDGRWSCTVSTGLVERRCFISDDKSPDTLAGRKQGVAAASMVALEGLQDEITQEEAKPTKELTQVFSNTIDVYGSNKKNWAYFWKHRPSAVGIDTEGNNKSPPVLVQISTDSYTILEAPRNGSISKDLIRLLADTRIVKVFCDNFSHQDKICLGISNFPDDLSFGHIVDLEAICNKLMGAAKVARGLSRIVSLSMPELNVRIIKPNRASKNRLKDIWRFVLIEQGKAPPLRSIYDLSHNERQYAALDAWCTLKAYHQLQQVTSAVTIAE